MSTYGREERADPAEPDRVSAAGADAIGEDAEAQAARERLGRTGSQAAPGDQVAEVAAAGELVPNTRADRPEPA
jgi:hypothetical protein